MKWRASARSAPVVVAFLLAACADPASDRLRATVTPAYDKDTGKLAELTSDANGNGRIDTWTEMDGARPLRSRADRDEDGTLDRWEYYDVNGGLVKVGFSRRHDGRPDAWAFSSPDGSLARIEASSTADENRIDRWEYYEETTAASPEAAVAPARVEEDTNADGRPDRWETYEGGVLETAAFDEDADGRPDRRLTYNGSTLILIESKPDAAGNFKVHRTVR
jgi:hypothetical protein